MLKFQLRHVVAYASRNQALLELAVSDFFKKTDEEGNIENQDKITGLFNEWLIFDFETPSGKTVIVDYYFNNPDGFSKELMDELKQIIETQHFDMFEIQSVKRGEWLLVYGLISGKTYKVYEKAGSLKVPDKGSFWGRVAQVNNHYILVGSNPVFLPFTSSDRLKHLYRENKQKGFSPKDVLPILMQIGANPIITERKPMTAKQLAQKREEIKTQFTELTKRYGITVSFDEVVDFVFNEKYKSNHFDFVSDLIKLGISEKALFSSIDVFNDIWNFFPHKILHHKSPHEIFKGIKK